MDRDATPHAPAALSRRAGVGVGAGAAGATLLARTAAQHATPVADGGGALAVHDVSLAQAQAVVAAAVAAAESIGTKLDIAVVDAGGILKASARMDGARVGGTAIAMRKARTACYFGMPTGDLGQFSRPGGPLYQTEVSNGGLISFLGGLPLRGADGAVIGAIGVSGSTVEDDHAVAEAGATAINY